jgi:hypothetical protein
VEIVAGEFRKVKCGSGLLAGFWSGGWASPLGAGRDWLVLVSPLA